MEPLRAYGASTAVQVILRKVNPDLKIDGKFGHFTREVYDRAPIGVRAEVTQLLTELGTSVESLSQHFVKTRDVRKAANSHNFVPASDAFTGVRRFATMFGAPQIADQIVGFLEIEAVKKKVDGVDCFDANSISPNGRYRGLFQMGEAAWADAQRFLGSKYDLGGFSERWSDPERNIAAAVAYAIINAKGLMARGYPVTPNTLYGAHNQGLGGFTSYIKKGVVMYPKQSKVALAVLADARRETKVA